MAGWRKSLEAMPAICMVLVRGPSSRGISFSVVLFEQIEQGADVEYGQFFFYRVSIPSVSESWALLVLVA